MLLKNKNDITICILTDDYPPQSFGGAGIIAEEHAQGLAQLGYNVHVITQGKISNKQPITDAHGIKVHSIRTQYPKFLRSWFGVINPLMSYKIYRLVREISPDIIHAHNIHSYISFFPLWLLSKKFSTYLTAHDAMTVTTTKVHCEHAISLYERFKLARFTWNPFREYLIKIFLKNVHVCSVSEALARVLRKNNIIIEKVILNGINFSKPDTEIHTSEYGLSNAHTYILFGGRISAAKGIYVALQALKEVIQIHNNVHLLCVGVSKDQRQSILAYAERLGVENNITLIPWVPREHMSIFYKISTCVIVPSQYIDPLPTVILEAMEYGSPLVVTNRGGSSEMIDTTTGYIVEPTQLNIRDAIIHIINNQEEAKNKALLAQTKVRINFSRSRFINDVCEWYMLQ